MVDYETIESKEVSFGKNNFIEIAKKRAISEGGENEFISISRGYYLEDGSKRWKASVALPQEKEKRDEIADFLKQL